MGNVFRDIILISIGQYSGLVVSNSVRSTFKIKVFVPKCTIYQPVIIFVTEGKNKSFCYQDNRECADFCMLIN